MSQFFVDNTHRVSVALLPDSELGKEREERERERLQVGPAYPFQCWNRVWRYAMSHGRQYALV
jgi:hypothetical protein